MLTAGTVQEAVGRANDDDNNYHDLGIGAHIGRFAKRSNTLDHRDSRRRQSWARRWSFWVHTDSAYMYPVANMLRSKTKTRHLNHVASKVYLAD